MYIKTYITNSDPPPLPNNYGSHTPLISTVKLPNADTFGTIVINDFRGKIIVLH